MEEPRPQCHDLSFCFGWVISNCGRHNADDGFFPQIEPIFKETNVSLPLITQIFLASGNFIIKWWWAVVLISILLVFLIIDYFQSREGKAVLAELIIKAPVFGNLFKKMYVARFAESTSVLIKGGIPITQAIEISGHAIGNIIYRDILHEVAEGVRAGELLSGVLSQNEYYFPSLVGQMVAISAREPAVSTKFFLEFPFFTPGKLMIC